MSSIYDSDLAFLLEGLQRKKGLKQLAIKLSRISRFSFFRILQGGLVLNPVMRKFISGSYRALGMMSDDWYDNIIPEDTLSITLKNGSIRSGLFKRFTFSSEKEKPVTLDIVEERSGGNTTMTFLVEQIVLIRNDTLKVDFSLA